MSEMLSADEDVRLQPHGPPEAEIAAKTRTLVVGPYLARNAAAQASGAAEVQNLRSAPARLDEATGLAEAVDLNVVQAISLNLSKIRPSTYLGKGRVEELASLITADQIGLVVMDCALSPVQQRNLEKAWGTKVIDRTGLILEIFGRSSTHTWPTRRAASCGHGPTWSVSAAALAFLVAPARRRSRLIGA
jgi:GTP-binding protein HflX